jgi:hypothetical protein
VLQKSRLNPEHEDKGKVHQNPGGASARGKKTTPKPSTASSTLTAHTGDSAQAAVAVTDDTTNGGSGSQMSNTTGGASVPRKPSSDPGIGGQLARRAFMSLKIKS